MLAAKAAERRRSLPRTKKHVSHASWGKKKLQEVGLYLAKLVESSAHFSWPSANCTSCRCRSPLRLSTRQCLWRERRFIGASCSCRLGGSRASPTLGKTLGKLGGSFLEQRLRDICANGLGLPHRAPSTTSPRGSRAACSCVATRCATGGNEKALRPPLSSNCLHHGKYLGNPTKTPDCLLCAEMKRPHRSALRANKGLPRGTRT